MTRSCWIWWSWRCVSAVDRVRVLGDEAPVVRVSALKALEGDVEWQAKMPERMAAVDGLSPSRQRDLTAVLDADRGRVHDHRAGDGGHGQGGAGQGPHWCEIEIVGLCPTQKTVYRGGDVPQDFDQGQAGDNIGALLRGTKKEDVERGQVLCKPRSGATNCWWLHFRACAGSVCWRAGWSTGPSVSSDSRSSSRSSRSRGREQCRPLRQA